MALILAPASSSFGAEVGVEAGALGSVVLALLEDRASVEVVVEGEADDTPVRSIGFPSLS